MRGSPSEAAAPAEDLSSSPFEVATANNAFSLVARLTLFLLVFHSGSGWVFLIPMKTMALIGIVWERALRDWLFWAVITAFLAYGNFLNWEINDNHQYLIMYWCLAIACALGAGSMAMLQGLARVLIGLTMALAVIWKLLSPDYLNGGMFNQLLLMDSRFESITSNLTNVSVEELKRSATLWQAFRASDSLAVEMSLPATHDVRWLALALSWWGVVAEFMVAVCFLVPGNARWLRRTGNVTLLAFIVTTYAVANVVGFGWVLAILGIAQCEPAQSRWRLAYLVSFFGVLLLGLPFGASE